MGEKIVDVKVNQDLGDGVEKIETQSQAGDKFKTTMAEAAETMKDLPGFERYQTTANASWNAAADRLMNAAKQVDQDPHATKYETGRRQADFKFQQDVLSATYNDLQKTAEAASKLSQAIGKHNGLKDLMTRTFPSMLTMAGNAMKLFEGSHKSLGNTSLMYSHFTRQMKEAAEENPHSDMAKMVTLLRGAGSKDDDVTQKKNAKDIWDYVFQVSSPQHRRASFMDKMSKDTSIDGTRYRSFRESLPASFAKLPVRHTQMIADKDWKQRYAADTARIQEKELEFLQARIMKNRVLMDAAVASGIAVKSKGRLLMNTNMPLRGQVNMMGGQVMEFMENALRGMPMYGITDIENPDNWDKLERKNNSRYRMAREAMEVLDEFAWFDPTYYTKTQARNLKRAAGSKFHSANASASVINHSPLYTAFEVPAYKIGDNGNLVEDAHLAIEDSIAMRAIRKHSDRDRAKTHNSLMEDTVYVNIDERLGDPQLGEYDRQSLLDKYADQVDNGFTPAGAKEKYVFVGVSKDSGIQFVRQSVKEKAEKANPGIFTGSHVTTDANGNIIPQTEYGSYTAFAGVLDGSRKNNTPGEDARNLFGSNLHKLTTKNIVVFDPTSWKKTDNPDNTLGDIPGLDGASFGDLTIIPFGAQGRMQGIKTALNPVHMANLHSLYSGAVKQPLQLKAASGIAGADEKVEFTEDTKLLISTEDIKDFKKRFAGKNNKEITEAILHDIQSEGLSIKTTFEDADKSSRWMSWQLAQTLEMSDKDQQLFNKVFMEEFALADTLGGAVDNVFAGNQTMQNMLKDNPQLMESPFVKAQIRDYRMNMLRRKSRGDILLPKDVKSHRQMFAPWIFNVMNESLLAAADGKFELPEFLKELSLKDNEVASLASWAKKLSVARFPATVGSIQLVDNVAEKQYLNSEGEWESLKKIAAFVGLDPEALYFNPNSSILAALQGADFDGDVGEIIEFAADDKNDYNAVIKHIIEKTQKSHEDQIKLGKLTEEDSKKKLEQLQHTLEDDNRTWSTTNGQDVAKYILHAAQSSSRMGSANAVTRNAFQMDRAQNFVSEALVDAYHRYDKNSTSAKKGVMMEPSKRELEVLGYGAPFAEFFRFVDKNGRDDQNNIDIKKLKERNPNFFKYNLPTKYSSGSVLSAMTTRYLAKQQYGDDVVTEDYNWNKIFDELYGEAKTDTAIDRMRYGLRQAYLGFLNSDYLALSDEDASWLAQLKKEAYDEVLANYGAYATQLETYKRDDSSNRPEALIMRMLNDLGGNTIDHLTRDGLIESVLNGDDYNFVLDAITGSGFGSGVSSLYKTHSQKFKNLKMSTKFQEQVEANRKKLQQEREHRLKFYDGYGPEKKHEIAKAIDDHKFSYSDLKLFADKPEDWLRYVMDPKTRPDYQTTDATEIGKVSHMIIQDYFEKREDLIKQRANDGNQFQFTEADIAKLEQHDDENLGDYFHRMLRDGYTPPNGSKYEATTKLNSDVLKSLQEGSKGGTLQEQYNGVRDFITRNMHAVLTEMINPKEWEYVPTKSEKPLSFKNAQLGNQINQPDNPVNVTGRADLVFRKRNKAEGAEDEYFIVDMKNFGKGMSEQDADHMRNQLYLYASADEFRKPTAAGETPAEVASQVTRMGFLLPAQQEFREVDASPEALEEAHGKYQTAIAEIQSLAETGLLDNYINQLKRSIGASLFGSGSAQHVDKEWKEKFSKELEAAQEAYYADEKAKYTNNELSGATIGKTLVLHEDYKEYMDNVHGVAKFANKQLSQYGQSQDYNVWESNAKRIAEAKEQARTLELRGMTEEAHRQDSDAQHAEKQFDKALKEAAPKALKEAQDLLRQINNEEKPSKGLTEKLEQYQELKQHIENAAKASKYLNAEIEQYTKDANGEQTKIDDSKKQLDKQNKHLEDRKKAHKEATDAKDEEAVERTTKEIASAQEKYNAEKARHDEASKELEKLNTKIANRKGAQAEAAENKASLDREAKLFEKKFKDDVLKYWEQVGTEFDQTRALTPQSKTASIQDLISGYKDSVINELAAMDKMVKDGKYDWFTEDSDLYKEQRAALQKHLDYSKVSEYQKNLIGRALADAEQWNNANYAVLTGEELDPSIAASMQAKTIAERIAEQKRSFEEQFEGVTLDKDYQTRYDAIKKLLDGFNEEDQVNKLTARAEFDKTEKAARDAYSLQADKQKQEDAIAAWRERIAARQSGKPYSPAAQQEREFQARMAAEEEQLRRYEAEAQRKDATASEIENAKARADSTRQYINDMRTLHAEELRVGATADLRDLNTSFEKQISRQGMSSAAISYAEQFDQLAKSIENASLKYDELKKKIEEQRTKGETPDAADLQALTDAEQEKAKAEANAKILKENQMDQQRTSNTARVDAFYNQFSAARTSGSGQISGSKWTTEQASRLKELEARAEWSKQHGDQEDELNSLMARSKQDLTPAEWDEAMQLRAKAANSLSPKKAHIYRIQKAQKDRHESVTQEDEAYQAQGLKFAQENNIQNRFGDNPERLDGYTKQRDINRFNRISSALNGKLLPEDQSEMVRLQQQAWDEKQEGRRLPKEKRDALKKLQKRYKAYNDLTEDDIAFHQAGLDLKQQKSQELAASAQNVSAAQGYLYPEAKKRARSIQYSKSLHLSEKDEKTFQELDEIVKNPLNPTDQQTQDNYESRWKQRLTPEEFNRMNALLAERRQHGLSAENEQELEQLRQASADYQTQVAGTTIGNIPVKTFDSRVTDAAKQADQTRKQLISDLKTEQTETKDAVRQNEIQAQIDGLESVSLEQMEQYYRQQFTEESNRVTENNAYRVRRLEAQGRRMDRDKYGMRDRSIFGRADRQRLNMRDQYEDRIDQIQIQKAELQKHQNSAALSPADYSKTSAQIADLDKQLTEAQKGFKAFDSSAATVKITLNELGQSASRVIAQFGRQLFHKALQEAKQFVMEFDSAMTEIQMITLKTDDEIAKLGDQLIQTSMDMKVSVSDVTSAASDLYRQGLSDDEVSVRLEDVVKFAKVAGIKTEEASKIITTALSNGLVDSSAEAMDALVALGDSAATTASEISKGMQKTAASAKEAGVSYEQLVTMLTIVTSKTQLGGSSAGTALSTLFYRLQKVGSSESFYDENGKLIADTATSRALSNIGVDLFNEDGSFRGAYDVLVDIAKNWEGASDIQQSAVLSSLGAGRQRSNIATLIQGLSEDDGALADKYLNLAANSDGITDEKYQYYLDSLTASLTNVTNAFDKFVESMNVEGVSTGFLDFISGAISGLASFNEMTSGVSTTVLGLAAAVVALTQACNANPIMMAITAGALALTGLFAGIGYLNEQSQIDHVNMVGDQTLLEYSTDKTEKLEKQDEATENLIKDTEELLKVTNRTSEEESRLDANLEKLERTFSALGIEMDGTIETYEDLTKAAEEYRKENEKLKTANAWENLQHGKNYLSSDEFTDSIESSGKALSVARDSEQQYDLYWAFIRNYDDTLKDHEWEILYQLFADPEFGQVVVGSQTINVTKELDELGAFADAQSLKKIVLDETWNDPNTNEDKKFTELIDDSFKNYSNEDDFATKALSGGLVERLEPQYRAERDAQLDKIVEDWFDLIAIPAGLDADFSKQVMDIFKRNIRAREEFYALDPEVVKNALLDEYNNLDKSMFNEDKTVNHEGLSRYTQTWNFNGQSGQSAIELEAAQKQFLIDQIGTDQFDAKKQLASGWKVFTDKDGKEWIESIGNYQMGPYESDGTNIMQLGREYARSLPYETQLKYYTGVVPDPTEDTSESTAETDAPTGGISEWMLHAQRLLKSSGETEDPKRDADNVVKTLLQYNVKDLSKVYDLMYGNILNLNSLLSSFPEIAAELDKYAKYDLEGNLIGFEDDVDAFAYILDMIASVSGEFSGSTFTTMREKAAGARAIFTSFNRQDFDTDGRAKWLQEIVGSELYAKIQTPAISLEGVDGQTNINDLFGPDLTDSETAYVKTLLSNAGYGVQGLTEQQRFEGARSMFELSKGEGFHNFMKSNASGMISDYASAIEGGADYFYAAERLSEEGYSSADLATIKDSGTGYEKINEILKGTGYSLDTFLEKQKEIDKEIETRTLRLFNEYGDSTENVIANFEQWDGKASDVASAMSEFNSAMSKAQRNAWLREQANGDNWTDEVVEGIAEMTGYSKEYIEEHKEDVKGLFETYEKADLESVQEEMSGLDEAFSAGLNDSQWALEVHPDIKAQLASGYNLDFSQVGNQLKGYVSDAFLAEVQNAVNSDVTGYVHVTQDADGKVHAKLVVEGVNSSGYTPPPRGGGGGKSAADKLLESHNREQTIRDHIIKMIQYEESMYQNAGQLTNYGIMLQHEIDEEKRQVAAKKEQIAALEKQISKTKKYSDDWYTLRDAIMKAEEEYEELTNTIEENNKKLEENQQAILKLHTELEQTVKQEIETRIQEEREMLDGTVSMQETIVEAIRERYREEWELMQKDIEKKRNALEEEKALIDERLNRRKEAEDEAKKHEELAEYQKQLALISMDPTRTSDVATLREKIQALEEELAWDLAEDEAKMQQDALQDQIDAYDQYEQEYQEWLDKYLEDANNFTDEVNHVMGLGHDELMQWLKDNVTEFGNSLEAAQEQMVQGWDDTFKQMKGIVDTYWDEINNVLSSKENFIAYMQESSSYKNASEDEKKQMLYNWGKAYDDYIAASVVSDEAVNYKHSDDFKGSSSNKSNTKKDKAPAATPESRYELLSLEEEIKQSLAKKTFAPIAKFAEGGLVDYTGPAWVDGTKTKPEAFLDAEDTSLLRAMLDGWKHVRNLPFMSNVSGVAEHGDGMSIGEVNVTLNEAQFNTDDDYETIAQKVGAAFTKELAKQGFSTARYAF